MIKAPKSVLAETAQDPRLGRAGVRTSSQPLGAERAEFALAGSVLLRQKGLAYAVARRSARASGSIIRPLPRESVWGAVAMAREALNSAARPRPAEDRRRPKKRPDDPTRPAWVPTRELPQRNGAIRARPHLDHCPSPSHRARVWREGGRVPKILVSHTKELESG